MEPFELNLIDKTDVFQNSLVKIHKNCSIKYGYQIVDNKNIFHDISGVVVNSDSYIYAFSDLGDIYKIELDLTKPLVLQNIKGNIFQKRTQGKKIDYEEAQYIQNSGIFIISREDIHSLSFMTQESDSAFLELHMLEIPKNFSKNLSFNKGIEAFVYREGSVYLFPEYGNFSYNHNREVCKLKLNSYNSSCEILAYASKSDHRVTSIAEQSGALYITEVFFDSINYFYKVFVQMLDVESLEDTKRCYKPETIAEFSFNNPEAKRDFIGNFEVINIFDKENKIDLFLWSDDNHGVYGETNNLLVISCEYILN